jgi:putative DNA primase/helicase
MTNGEPKANERGEGRAPEQGEGRTPRELSKPDIETRDVPLRLPGKQALAALTRVNDDALQKTNLPRLYVRGGEPVRVRYNEDGELTIQDMSVYTVMHEVTNAAEFWRTPKKGDPELVSPPKDVCHYVLNALQWSFPRLNGITSVPVFRPDGTVVTERGYDPVTGLIYDPPAGFVVSMPEEPAEEDVENALSLIGEVIGDFPYADKASRANTIALAMTPVLREVIDGPVPLAAIDKPTPGTGASLLIESLALATSGSLPGALGAVEDDNEMRKQITSKLRNSEAWVLLDNVNVELKSASLAKALTCGVWEDRILGVSKTLRVPIRNVWVATANNLELSLELARRTYWIRLDARVARPWERPTEEFTHPDLKGWVREQRAVILSALLTLGRYWFLQGKPVPEGAPVMGSFESWSKTLAGVLSAAGVEGFLENSKGLYERSTEDVGLWAFFLDVWRKTYGGEGVTTQTLAEALQSLEHKDLREALPGDFSLMDEHLARKLGRAFSKKEGVRYGSDNLHIVRAGAAQRAVKWAVRAGDEA